MAGSIGIIGNADGELAGLVSAGGMRPVTLTVEQLTSGRDSGMPEALLVDVRQDRSILGHVSLIKRRHPTLGIAIVSKVLSPEVMLEGMRAGVTEALAEPLTAAAIQAAVGRMVVPQAVPVQSRVYAIIGAKGGVGTTTIAVNLAAALAKTLEDALLLDLNFAAGDAAVFLGVEPRFTVAEALENADRLDAAFLRSLVVRSRSGFDLLGASPRVTPSSVDAAKLRDLVQFVSRYYHAVVLDVPRLDVSLLDALDVATGIFVVLNHELPTIRSAYRLVSSLRQKFGERVSVVVNRSDKTAEIGLADIEKTVGVKVRHVFPNDYRMAVAAINKGQPFAESSTGRLAESFHALARSLAGQEREELTADNSGLFGWLSPKRTTR